MPAIGTAQITIYLVVLLALVKPLGGFMARVYQGERTFLEPVLGPVEHVIYRIIGIRPEQEMPWQTYALALHGVPYRPLSADRLLRDNLLLYGLGGLVTPFVGIKLIDLILVGLGLT